MRDSGTLLVEFIGSAGVGKSSVLQHLAKSPPLAIRGWLPMHQALRRPRTHLLARLLSSWVRPMQRKLTSFQRLIYQPVSSSERHAALLAAAAEWSPFIDVCIRAVNEGERPAVERLLALQGVASGIQLRALLASDRDAARLVLWDESLSHRSLKLFSERFRNLELERSFFSTMPLPTMLVHLRARPETIVQRLQARQAQKGRSIPRHKGLSNEDILRNTLWGIEVARMGAEILERRGVPVLQLDTEAPVASIAEQVARFVAAGKVMGALHSLAAGEDLRAREDRASVPRLVSTVPGRGLERLRGSP